MLRNQASQEGPLKPEEDRGWAILINCLIPSPAVPGLWVEVYEGLREKRPALTLGTWSGSGSSGQVKTVIFTFSPNGTETREITMTNSL